jgi:transposase
VCLPGWGRRAPAKPAIQVTPDFIAPFSQKPGVSPPSASVCEEYRELIEQGLVRGRNGKAIWQDLVSDHGFAGDYQAVKRFVRKLRGPQRPEAAGIILTAPGEEAQVDYGSGPMVRDPKTSKYRRTRLFVLTLGYSRKSVRLLSWRSSGRIWAELLAEMIGTTRPRVNLLMNKFRKLGFIQYNGEIIVNKSLLSVVLCD